MSDSIKNDDEKFQKLISKQSSAVEPKWEKSEDSVENDDDEMDRLMMLQDLSQESEWNKPDKKTIEEKYEQEIAIEQFLKKVDERLEAGGDVFEQFFIDIEPTKNDE